FRKYDGPYDRKGYGFPVGNGNIENALSKLKTDAENENSDFQFCFLSESQKDMLDKLYPDTFSFSTDEGDSDYIYRTKGLAQLKGHKYHKHKNKVSKFCKSYPQMEIRKIDETNVCDAIEVEEKWLSEHNEDKMFIVERDAIFEALKYIKPLDLNGIIIYANNKPVAMSVSSVINNRVCDIHFEKSYGEYANNGGYSAICSYMANELKEIEYLNREEDLGISGLRKSKMSYHPLVIYKKYIARSC
ncbi:MAG: DUF2156 domain-containing protein, partial [Ruminococcus sp.]|nr:DUF2156 domain-containing protein [Candidatus Copronaster equi]